MRKPYCYMRIDERESKKQTKEYKSNVVCVGISFKKLTVGNWEPLYLRSPTYNSDQRMRRKNHKILDSLLQKENVMGTNIEIILEKDYRASVGFECGNEVGMPYFIYDKSNGLLRLSRRINYGERYRPAWCPHNDYQESRHVKGVLEELDFKSWSNSAVFLLKYEKGKYLSFTSGMVKEIKVR